MAAVVVVVVVVAGVALACGVACCYRRMYCPSWLLGRRASRKRRVVVMHSNSLYDGDAATKHHQHPHHHQQQQQLAFLMPPRVKVETSSTRASRRRFLSTVLEYEIPLDPHWEFARDKSVAGSAFIATSSEAVSNGILYLRLRNDAVLNHWLNQITSLDFAPNSVLRKISVIKSYDVANECIV